jgi:hypothetical protein
MGRHRTGIASAIDGAPALIRYRLRERRTERSVLNRLSAWVIAQLPIVLPELGRHSVSDINENQVHSRPSRVTLLIGLVVVLGVVVIAYWAEISAFAHIPQIKSMLGL